MKNGKFIISLDFELMYGLTGLYTYPEYKKNIDGVPEAVEKILRLFEEYDISATWAVVGMMFFNDKKELINNLPDGKPNYKNKKVSNYEALDDIFDGKAYFAKDLISKVAQTKGQEIATHTFSHYYCDEKGQTKADFDADLSKAIETHAKFGYEKPVSIIFPKNMVNEKYMDVLKKNNIRTYRGTPKIWIDKVPLNILRRMFRLIDIFFNITGYQCFVPEYSEPINIPASRFLRHYDGIKLLEKIKVGRIKKQMKYAAKNKKCFHLWWHPHNFGNAVEENIKNLREILEYYKKLEQQYDFESTNMKNLGEQIYEDFATGRR